MEQNDIRQAIRDERENQFGLGLLGIEVVITSIILGFLTTSWIIFGIVLVGSFILVYTKSTIVFVLIAYTLMWMYIGYRFGDFISPSASIVTALIFLFISAAIHLASYRAIQDLD